MDKKEVIKIEDNFLDEKYFLNLKSMFFSHELPWFRQSGVATMSDEMDEKADCFFCHIFFKNHTVCSPKIKELSPLLDRLKDLKALIRIHANFYPRTQDIHEHEFHKDYPFNNKTIIFSINTNNGYTKLISGEKIDSVENRLLLFDGSIEHKSSTCSDKFGRINLVVNYL